MKILSLVHVSLFVRRYKELQINEDKSLFTSLIALMMEAVSTSETSVNLCKTMWRNFPENDHIHRYITFIFLLFKSEEQINNEVLLIYVL
jgi:hypothetical protein